MSSPQPATRRNPVLVIVDVVASVLVLFFDALVAVTAIVYAGAFRGFTSDCGSGPFTGLECNDTALAIASYGLTTVAILAFFLAMGAVIVSLIRRKYTIWWAVGALVVTIAAFYLASWIAGQTVPL